MPTSRIRAQASVSDPHLNRFQRPPLGVPLVGPRVGEVWRDVREHEGEPLWPERFPRDGLALWAAEMGTHAAAGQLQQRPTARQGGLFKREWFVDRVKAVPPAAVHEMVRAWDLASTAGDTADPDYTVGLKMHRDPITSLLYISEVIRQRWSPAAVEAGLLATAKRDGYGCKIRLPREPAQSGKFQAWHFTTKLQGFSVNLEPEMTSKENRADPFAAQCEVGNVKLVEGSWNQAFIDELCAFPVGSKNEMLQKSFSYPLPQ